MYKIAILASGNGSNAEEIIKTIPSFGDFQVELLISNNSNSIALKRAESYNIATAIFSKEEFSTTEKPLQLIKEKSIDAVILAGFLLLVPESIVTQFPTINIHPALLPKFGGKGMYGNRVHQAVIDAKELESGITIHTVDREYDKGEILLQAKCPVKADDTPLTLAQRVHELEYKYFTKTIANYLLSLT